jgi:protein TonB
MLNLYAQESDLMTGAGTELAREASMDTVFDNKFRESAALEVLSGGKNRWWYSWARIIREKIEAEQVPARGHFHELVLNVAILLGALAATVVIIGVTGMLHNTKTVAKKKAASDIHMLLTKKETPPPLEMEDDPFLEEPEMIYTAKNIQTPQTEKMPPKINIDLPRIDINAKLPMGLDIGMNTWNIPSPKTEYGIGEVDQVPIATFQIPPDYPYHAKRQGTEGVVSIRFLVTREGTVSSFSVIKATPEGIFDEAARRSVLRWKFKPGVKDGKAVDTWVEMDIEFDLG